MGVVRDIWVGMVKKVEVKLMMVFNAPLGGIVPVPGLFSLARLKSWITGPAENEVRNGSQIVKWQAL